VSYLFVVPPETPMNEGWSNASETHIMLTIPPKLDSDIVVDVAPRSVASDNPPPQPVNVRVSTTTREGRDSDELEDSVATGTIVIDDLSKALEKLKHEVQDIQTRQDIPSSMTTFSLQKDVMCVLAQVGQRTLVRKWKEALHGDQHTLATMTHVLFPTPDPQLKEKVWKQIQSFRVPTHQSPQDPFHMVKTHPGLHPMQRNVLLTLADTTTRCEHMQVAYYQEMYKTMYETLAAFWQCVVWAVQRSTREMQAIVTSHEKWATEHKAAVAPRQYAVAQRCAEFRQRWNRFTEEYMSRHHDHLAVGASSYQAITHATTALPDGKREAEQVRMFRAWMKTIRVQVDSQPPQLLADPFHGAEAEAGAEFTRVQTEISQLRQYMTQLRQYRAQLWGKPGTQVDWVRLNRDSQTASDRLVELVTLEKKLQTLLQVESPSHGASQDLRSSQNTWEHVGKSFQRAADACAFHAGELHALDIQLHESLKLEVQRALGYVVGEYEGVVRKCQDQLLKQELQNLEVLQSQHRTLCGPLHQIYQTELQETAVLMGGGGAGGRAHRLLDEVVTKYHQQNQRAALKHYCDKVTNLIVGKPL